MGNACEPQRAPTMEPEGHFAPPRAAGAKGSAVVGLLDHCCSPHTDVVVIEPAAERQAQPGDALALKRQIQKTPTGDLDQIYSRIRPFLNAGRKLTKEQRRELGLALIRNQPSLLVELTKRLDPPDIETVAEAVLDFQFWWKTQPERVQTDYLERHHIDSEEVDRVTEFRLLMKEFVSWSRRFKDDLKRGMPDYASTPLTREFLRNSGMDLVRVGSVRIDTRLMVMDPPSRPQGHQGDTQQSVSQASLSPSTAPSTTSPARSTQKTILSPQKSILKGSGGLPPLHLEASPAASPSQSRPGGDARLPDGPAAPAAYFRSPSGSGKSPRGLVHQGSARGVQSSPRAPLSAPAAFPSPRTTAASPSPRMTAASPRVSSVSPRVSAIPPAASPPPRMTTVRVASVAPRASALPLPAAPSPRAAEPVRAAMVTSVSPRAHVRSSSFDSKPPKRAEAAGGARRANSTGKIPLGAFLARQQSLSTHNK